MPGLDLSSNWKILQARLQAEKRQSAASNESNGVKRKRPEVSTGSSKYLAVKKRARVTGDNATTLGKKRKMGGYMSSEAQPAKAHSTLVSKHDIPASDVSAAYGAPTPSSVGSKFHDIVNGGLHPTHKAGKYLSLDCEMVGTGPPPHTDDILARVSLVNFNGEQIYDSYVQKQAGDTIEDYRTFVSGIKPGHMKAGYARPFAEVVATVDKLLQNRILVGHALKKDLQVLTLSHAQRDIRDTSRYAKFRVESRGKPPALRKLARSELGLEIQTGEHSSIEDARATMMLFRKEKAGFEEENKKVFGVRGRMGGKKEAGKKSVAAVEEDDDSEEEEEEVEDDELSTLDGEEDTTDYFAEAGISTAGAAKRSGGAAKKKRKKKNNTKRK
jgi:RNA exonuclease 4